MKWGTVASWASLDHIVDVVQCSYTVLTPHRSEQRQSYFHLREGKVICSILYQSNSHVSEGSDVNLSIIIPHSHGLVWQTLHKIQRLIINKQTKKRVLIRQRQMYNR